MTLNDMPAWRDLMIRRRRQQSCTLGRGLSQCSDAASECLRANKIRTSDPLVNGKESAGDKLLNVKRKPGRVCRLSIMDLYSQLGHAAIQTPAHAHECFLTLNYGPGATEVKQRWHVRHKLNGLT